MTEHPFFPERIFGLSVIDGDAAVRPGSTVRFRFRTRNANDIATPPARLSFHIPAGWSPLDPGDAEIPSIAPGGYHDVVRSARPDRADERTAISRVQAVLHVDDAMLGSNIVRVRVTGCPRFTAPASTIRIESAGGDALRVAVELVNDGDAVARNVRVTVPPPPGFAVAGDATWATSDALAPGAAFAFAYTMRPVAPSAANVTIDDAFVAFDGGRAALVTGAQWLLGPELAPPSIDVRRTANRLDLNVRVRNDGWVPARDARCAIDVPAGWQILRGTLLVGAAPALARRDPDASGVTIVLPFVPARGSVDIAAVATATRGPAGSIAVRCGDHRCEAPIPSPVSRAIHLAARADSAFAEPGSVVPIAVDVYNAGETATRLTFGIDGTDQSAADVRPGTACAWIGHAVVPAGAHGTDHRVHVAAVDDDGETLARVTVDLRVPDRPASEGSMPPAAVAIPGVEATLHVPPAVPSGARFDVRLECAASTRIEMMCISPRPHAGAMYVSGSTAVNGYAIVDGIDGPPLMIGEGLALHDVPPRTTAVVRWSLLARAPGELLIGVDLRTDGESIALTRSVIVVAALPFAARPAGLPFHIDAATVDAFETEAGDAHALIADAVHATLGDADELHVPGLSVGLTMDAERCARLRRILGGSRMPGIVGHLPVLAVLFPDATGADDPSVTGALAAAGAAVSDVFQKLFVKLRIPGYDVTAADLEDDAARRALVALLDAAVAWAPERRRDSGATLTRAIAPDRLRVARTALAVAPLGGAVALQTLLALVPTDGEHAVDRAAGDYLATFEETLARVGDRDERAFAHALVREEPGELDAARETLLAALDADEAHAAR